MPVTLQFAGNVFFIWCACVLATEGFNPYVMTYSSRIVKQDDRLWVLNMVECCVSKPGQMWLYHPVSDYQTWST